MKNIFITGGLGYIGSHICTTLFEQNYNIYILDSLYNSSIFVLEKLKIIKKTICSNNKSFIKFFQGEIRDKLILNKIFEYSLEIGYPIDAVIHCSGLKSVAESNVKPELYWDVNVHGTEILLEVMEKNNCKTIIFSSSATVYGNSTKKILTEHTKIQPTNIYGKTKAYAEKVLLSKFNQSEGWKVINLRYFNPIGAHKSFLIGEIINKKSTNLFTFICKAAIKEIKNLQIFGNDWDTKDGTCVRDFIHILDIASGHIAALNYLNREEKIYKCINLGTSKGRTILELVEIFEKVTNYKINYSFSDKRLGDVNSYVASNQLALKYLDWMPKYSIEEMCFDGWNWFLKQRDFNMEI